MTKIRKLRSNDPKNYWKIINKKVNIKQCNVNINEFYKYIKKYQQGWRRK